MVRKREKIWRKYTINTKIQNQKVTAKQVDNLWVQKALPHMVSDH